MHLNNMKQRYTMFIFPVAQSALYDMGACEFVIKFSVSIFSLFNLQVHPHVQEKRLTKGHSIVYKRNSLNFC